MTDPRKRSRRDFIKGLFALPLCLEFGRRMMGPTDALASVEASSASLPRTDARSVIDTHVHFYDPTRPGGVPWPDKSDRILYRKVMPSDYQALPKPRPVAGVIVIEASPWLEDNQWVLDLAASNPLIVGFIGNLPVGTPAFVRHLDRFAANPVFRGIRIGADCLKRNFDMVRADLARLAEKNLTLDCLGDSTMLPDVGRLAQAVPDLRIMIDHVALVRIDGGTPDPGWEAGIKAVARHPNVFCKLSGLAEATGRADGSAPRAMVFYRPVLDLLWSAFGPDRLMYGSNWPVCERFASCATVQGIVEEYVTAKGSTAFDVVFRLTADRAYRYSRSRG